MTTTAPDWLPTWPATFADVEAAYAESVPRQYPEGLYQQGTDEYTDLVAQSVVLSWVRQGSEWVIRRIFPQLDTDGLFLGLWEGCLGVVQRATTAGRQAAIVASARYGRGTATTEKIQNIFAPIFGIDPGDVAFRWATLAEIATAGPDAGAATAKCHNMLHIYDANETAEPDRTLAEDAIALCKPTWQTWSCGRMQYLKWGAHANDGAWNERVWG